jgi:hypothetical protein
MPLGFSDPLLVVSHPDECLKGRCSVGRSFQVLASEPKVEVPLSCPRGQADSLVAVPATRNRTRG